MKIVNTNIPVIKRFDELKIGDVFRSKSGTYYMKINPVEVVVENIYANNLMDIDTDTRNAICLINGVTAKFISSAEVTPVNCELIIK